MIKKLFDSFFILLSSGVLLHRSTVSGVLCAVWAAATADPDESAFACLMNADLYFALAVFLAFYRFSFKKVTRRDKTLDLQEMGMGFLGDFVWAVLAMVCAAPFFSDDDPAKSGRLRGTGANRRRSPFADETNAPPEFLKG